MRTASTSKSSAAVGTGSDELRIQRRLDRERFKMPNVELKNSKTNEVG